jgi:hypothetical protein
MAPMVGAPRRRYSRLTVRRASTSLAALAAVAAVALLLAGDRWAARAAGAVAFREIDHGTRPGSGDHESPRGRVLRTQAGATRVLRGWGLDRAIAAATSVDFGERSVVVALDASRPSTGYRLRVVRIDVRNRRALVTVTVRRADGIDGQAISRPYAVVSVPRRALVGATRGVVVRLRS